MNSTEENYSYAAWLTVAWVEHPAYKPAGGSAVCACKEKGRAASAESSRLVR